jgi:hypothetical protein
MKRREVTVFSLTFLDCICCGLGAVILLFVIVNAKSAAYKNDVTADLRSEVRRLQEQVLQGKKGLVEARNTLEETRADLVVTRGLSTALINAIEDKKQELAYYEKDTLATKAHVNTLKADLRSVEEGVRRLEAGSKTGEEHGAALRPFPGEGDRQYLTDLKVGGARIFILLDASASMLDESIVGIIRRRNLKDVEKLRSEKWQQAVGTMDWLTSQLPPASQFQVYTFNETARPLIERTTGSWLGAQQADPLNESLEQLRRVVPQRGTSLLNAFKAMEEMKPGPDNIFLLTDSLPTMGARKPLTKRVSAGRRERLFREAVRILPSRVPVNVVLFPMEGDPRAASLFWQLAVNTNGAFFCPSKDWP